METLERDNLTGKNHTGSRANTPVRLLTASSVIGDKVYNRKDEKLGDVKDVMLNIADGTIEYFIIEFGGFLGIGEKYFAVPFQALTLDTDRHAFIIDQSKEMLEKAPGFDKDHWPETNSHVFHDTSVYWGDFMGSNVGSEPY